MNITAGINKLVLLEFSIKNSESKISLPDHLIEKKYKIVSVGTPKTSFEIPHELANGDTVRIIPNSGHSVEEDGKKYLICSIDDVLCKIG